MGRDEVRAYPGHPPSSTRVYRCRHSTSTERLDVSRDPGSRLIPATPPSQIRCCNHLQQAYTTTQVWERLPLFALDTSLAFSHHHRCDLRAVERVQPSENGNGGTICTGRKRLTNTSPSRMSSPIATATTQCVLTRMRSFFTSLHSLQLSPV